MISFRTISRLGALATLSLATAAVVAAPWQWRDASGRMVYSDRPPPTEVRAAQIVRAPSSSAPGLPAAVGAPASPTDASAASPDAAQGTPAAPVASTKASAAPLSWAEREVEFRKRMLERNEAEEKERVDRQHSETAKRACDDMRTTLRTLESGLRVVAVDAKGEAGSIDEVERERRLAVTRRDLASHCASS